jgi:hypothetical protein
MPSKAKDLIALGRRAAAKTFTRNKNNAVEERKVRQARALSNATNPSCVAYFPWPWSFLFALVLTALLFAATSAAQAAPTPWWNINTSVRPATVAVGGEATLVARASNLGNAPTTGPSTLSITLPEGIEALTEEVEGKTVPRVSFYAFSKNADAENENLAAARDPIRSLPLEFCSMSEQRVSCQTEPPATFFEKFFSESPFNEPPLNEPPVKENIEGVIRGAGVPPLNPYEYIEIRVKVKDTGAPSGSEFMADVSGGAAAAVSAHRSLPIGSAAATFGVEEYSLVPEEAGGSVDTRAGSHPYQLTTTFDLDQTGDPTHPPALPRNLHFRLPPGQIGNTTAVPQCSALDFATVAKGGNENLCPADTAIGVAAVTLDEPVTLGLVTYPVPLFNLTPAVGEPARFGFTVANSPVILDTSVRSGAGEDYGVNVNVSNITQLVNFLGSTVTFWGVPGDPSHDHSRGWNCLVGGHWAESGRQLPCEPQKQLKPPAFLTQPTNCEAPFVTAVEGESWTDPAHPVASSFSPFSYSLGNASGLLGLTGCNKLAFSPAIAAKPSTDSASSPSGLEFDLNFDDEGLTNNAAGLAQSQLKDTSVTLPEGFTINPSAGVGLGGCSPAQYASESVESPPGAGCPNDSKLGTVEVKTPLLEQTIEGSIFIAQPYENPFGSLVALYVVAKNPETGILIKLAGKVTPNPITGQLVTTFENNPQLPFDHFSFKFREGQQAPLVSPPTCGAYATQATLTPWSDPLAALTDSSAFTITKGAEGGSCPSDGAPPFNPKIEAGTQNNNAGTFSPFYLHLTRTDAEQEISRFSTNLPPGLTGDLSGIPFCSDATIASARTKSGAQEEAEPSCPAASQIGHTLVGTGVGAVLAYVPGKIYLAGAFGGDPLSIVSVTSAVVGPFDLGTVVIRFGLRIDPYTAQVSVDPSASEPIPTILDGIVTHVRDIRVYIERPGNAPFTLNPTSCAPTSIGSTLTSSLGASSTIASPFQAASCANLKFAPKFAVSTSGKTSKAKGASLKVKLTYPQGPAGTYANIARVKVDLPKQLPSQLKTLQKACTAKQFELNPANCPKESMVGKAKAVTPLIPVPLEGPAIFVSHGNEAFPSLIMVLKGAPPYDITIDLVGTTFISKAGITSSTFKTVPDQPIGSFELTLPQGKFSALAANGNLCTVKGGLKMPTEFLAQNGAEIKEDTKIAVTGCPKHKAKKAAKKKKHQKAGKKAKKK